MKILTASHGSKPALTKEQVNNGFIILDITAKSGCSDGMWLAPSWENINEYKSGIISESEFTKRYFETVRTKWDMFKLMSNRINDLRVMKLILVCYCRPGIFCHRYLASEFLVGEECATYYGEYSVNV